MFIGRNYTKVPLSNYHCPTFSRMVVLGNCIQNEKNVNLNKSISAVHLHSPRPWGNTKTIEKIDQHDRCITNEADTGRVAEKEVGRGTKPGH